MAGPGFDLTYKRDPKEAGFNVQCIHTSIYAGTATRNCHQNWLMGYCGKIQPGGQELEEIYCAITGECDYDPTISHSLCPYFYISAFENDFFAYNRYHCLSTRYATNLPENFKMGYMETRKK
jgi:hypothetical protein